MSISVERLPKEAGTASETYYYHIHSIMNDWKLEFVNAKQLGKLEGTKPDIEALTNALKSVGQRAVTRLTAR